jgi:hypothetical protein
VRLTFRLEQVAVPHLSVRPMHIPAFIVTIAIVLMGTHSAHGYSGYIELSSSNIRGSVSFISLRTSTYSDEGDVRVFRVIVQPTHGIDPANFFGSLRVLDASSNIVSSCAIRPGALPAKSQDVAPALRDHSVVFEFSVSARFLQYSTFYAVEQLPDVPSFTAYWFFLKDYPELEPEAEPVAPREPPPRVSVSDVPDDRTLDLLPAPVSGGGR